MDHPATLRNPLSRPLGPGGVAAAAILLALAATLASGFWGFSYDDAFITYRYAQNLAEHGELAYNRGEAVLGTSAPGYGVLLGVAERLLPLGIPQWGTLLGYLALLICALLAGALLASRPARERVALSLLFGLLALTCRWNLELVGGEALPILALAGMGAYLALVRDRPVAAGLAVGLATLFRLDALLVAGSIGLLAWVVKRRFPWAYTLTVAALLAPFLAWLQARFHTIVPVTLGAKRAELALAGSGYTRAQLGWLERCLPS
ncbi:MAG TPA: hypothetical protein VMM92_14105, partial [Thermoanaerobaculia bacterium]|nr:hypothetical protein [Thermoanaerobaculia bacterium]